ncbi:MAG: hypothetical protein WAP47_03915 [Candidatus Rokuibacteriota bacterium]
MATPPPPALRTDTYERIQTTGGYVSLGTSVADIIAFAGTPDRIEIVVLDFAADLYFTDEQGRDSHPIRVEPAVAYDPQIRARKVRGANAVAGSVARVQAVGKWQRSCVYDES